MFDAIVLAGAASRRLDGADKALVEIGGRTLLDTVLAADRGRRRVIVAGPQRPVARRGGLGAGGPAGRRAGGRGRGRAAPR